MLVWHVDVSGRHFTAIARGLLTGGLQTTLIANFPVYSTLFTRSVASLIWLGDEAVWLPRCSGAHVKFHIILFWGSVQILHLRSVSIVPFRRIRNLGELHRVTLVFVVHLHVVHILHLREALGLTLALVIVYVAVLFAVTFIMKGRQVGR